MLVHPERRSLRWYVPRQLVALGALACSACAGINDTGMALFASSADAYAVVDDQLLAGTMKLLPDRTATLLLRPMEQDGQAPPMRRPSAEATHHCSGRMRPTGAVLAVVDLRCNDGRIVALDVALIGDTRGYGHAGSAAPGVSLVFGMDPEEALAHLRPPRGRRLVLVRDGAALELR